MSSEHKNMDTAGSATQYHVSCDEGHRMTVAAPNGMISTVQLSRPVHHIKRSEGAILTEQRISMMDRYMK